ncbi:MAG: hypothetical protein NT124_05350 [Candidatus Dependentiae bacterium]|nr:hypothetical protein [Candidatus Dependentiae bacterium]
MNITKSIALALALACGALCTTGSYAMGNIRLVGVGNYFEALRTSPTERPTVRITKVGNQKQSIFINPQPYQGQLQIVDQPLPIEIEVKFNTHNNGQPYTIVVERVTDPKDMLACQGVSMATVKAYVKGHTINMQKICVPLSTSTIPTAFSPINSGDFNSIAFFVGPLGINDKYDPQDVGSLPFRFGLMGWTSLVAPWNNKTLSSTSDTKNIQFGRPVDVLQGFAALGGGFIPRAYHASVGHIFNDSDDIIILSRESSNKTLAPFNNSQIIPPHSVIPYGLVWIPKVQDSEELMLPGHDGLRIAALEKGTTAPAPGVIRHSDIKELGPLNTAAIPQGLQDLEALIAGLNRSVTNDAADLLGVTLWNKDMQSSYTDFNAAEHYYVLSTDATDKSTYLQKFSVQGNRLGNQDTQKIAPFVSYNQQGVPNYCNIVITHDKTKSNTFQVTVYPTVLRAPKRRDDIVKK